MSDIKKKVSFVIDDDPVTGNILKEFLSEVCDVVLIGDEAALAESWKTHMPDIVFLDIHMPAVSGLNLIKDIKARGNQIAVVMVTADATADNVNAALKNGANGFIVKPFDKNTVLKNFHRFSAAASAQG